MKLIMVIYCIGGLIAFFVWLTLLLRDSTTPITDGDSWKILLLVSFLWPITVPISLMELVFKNQKVKPTFIHSSSVNPLPLGYLLKKAGLVSESQVIQALKVQQTTHNYMRIGEIIVSYGWLSQETVDFFAESLIQMRTQPKQPIGQYLKSAKLLNDLQIDAILKEQYHTNLRFGEIAVTKGWIKPETVDFILDYLQGQPGTVLSNRRVNQS
ncbi:hypothetical protein ACL6C3_00140 [Capilliphycus salinus ALCB114379]|uniref:hypothetical protein n=1 Tax=Capilliphycus salinus TaxID=2768948 RepID=UPI0039A4FD3D